jgi:Arc/MetJ-type ribon-helix-helix transcriptional regulator
LLHRALESAWLLIYIGRMNIKLPREQSEWLQTQVDAGHFPSVDDAVTMAVADLMAVGADDLAWAKPYVDEARAAVSRGEIVPADDAIADIDAHMAALKR